MFAIPRHDGFRECEAPSREQGPRVSINTEALSRNYKLLERVGGSAEILAVVKGRGYGYGDHPEVIVTLYQAGCRRFWVESSEEAAFVLRSVSRLGNDVAVYLPINELAGRLDNESIAAFLRPGIVPVLFHHEHIVRFNAYGKEIGSRIPAAIKFDVGLRRRGIIVDDISQAGEVQFAEVRNHLESLEVHFVCSHFSGATRPESKVNTPQIEKMQFISRAFPHFRTCFANSSGIFMLAQRGLQSLSHINRPGYALWGGNPIRQFKAPVTIGKETFSAEKNPMEPVFQFHAPIRLVAEVRDLAPGAEGRKVTAAQIPISSLSIGNLNIFVANKGCFAINGQLVRVLAPGPEEEEGGFIYLELPESLKTTVRPGMQVELLGPHITLDYLAEKLSDNEHKTTGYHVPFYLGMSQYPTSDPTAY